MRLYRGNNYPTRWFAFSSQTGWVMFPAEFEGWKKRQPARGIDPMHVREIPLRMAFGTGIPGAPGALDEDETGFHAELEEAA